VIESGLRLIPGLLMSGTVLQLPLPPPIIRFLAQPVIGHCVIYEAVKESFLSYKSRVELGITFLGKIVDLGCELS
jgi:hypothetical protein